MDRSLEFMFTEDGGEGTCDCNHHRELEKELQQDILGQWTNTHRPEETKFLALNGPDAWPNHPATVGLFK